MLKFVLMAIGATICIIGAAAAQTNYSTHPIRMIVPFAPDGSTDSQAQIVAAVAAPILDQTGQISSARPDASCTVLNCGRCSIFSMKH